MIDEAREAFVWLVKQPIEMVMFVVIAGGALAWAHIWLHRWLHWKGRQVIKRLRERRAPKPYKPIGP